MKLLPSLLAAGFALAMSAPLCAQVTIDADYLTAYGARQAAAEIPVAAHADDASPFEQLLAGLSADFRYRFSTAAVKLRQPREFFPEPIGSDPALNAGSHIRFKHTGATDGAFRPFVSVAVGRYYGEGVDEAWSAGIGGGARYYLQPRTFLRASVEYGWEFSHIRGMQDRLTDGQWTWSMGLGFQF